MSQEVSSKKWSIVFLISVCAIGVMLSVLGALQLIQRTSAFNEDLSNRQWEAQAQSSLSHFYQVQKEQLQLRLNELAFEEKLDDQVVQNYTLRINQYTNEIAGLEKKQTEFEEESHALESRRDRQSRLARWLLGGAMALTLTLLAIVMGSAIGSRILAVLAWLLFLGTVAMESFGLLVYWR